ncbi:MAG: hypothetical protein ACLQB4_16450 [Beijerinckiaceae bacterium]
MDEDNVLANKTNIAAMAMWKHFMISVLSAMFMASRVFSMSWSGRQSTELELEAERSMEYCGIG